MCCGVVRAPERLVLLWGSTQVDLDGSYEARTVNGLNLSWTYLGFESEPDKC